MSSYQTLYEAFLSDPDLLEQMATQDLEIAADCGVSGFDEYLARQPTNYFKWAAIASIAEARASKQRYLVKEELWPVARATARMKLEKNGSKVTESRVDDEAMVDKNYRSGQTLLVDLEGVAGTLRAAEKAMGQRLEMLRSLNSRQRGELGGYPRDVVEEATEAYLDRKHKKAAATRSSK